MTNDLFNFRDYVLFLKDKLDNTDLSQVVWVHWDYWAWKSTTMNIIKELYQEDNLWYDNILEFSAWRNYYNNEHTVWKALLYELAGKIYDIFDNDDIKNSINYDNIKLNEIKNINDLDINKNIDKVILLMEWFKIEENKTVFWKIKQYFENIKKIQNPDELNSYLNNVKNELVSLYVKNISLEIQYNLYQDLKDFDWELKEWKSEFQKNKFLWMLNLVSSIIPNLFSFEWIQNFADLFQKEEQELIKPKIDSLEVIQRKFDILLELYNLISFTNDKITKKPLIIMVDDLDRILPEKSVEIIEILRIFFEKSNKIHFICAIDLRVIEKWIERKFNQLNKWWDLSRIEFEEYLEKIITIPFDLPAIPLVDFDVDNNIFWIDTLIDNKIKERYIVKKDILTELTEFIPNIDKKSIMEKSYFLRKLDKIKNDYIKDKEFNNGYLIIKSNFDILKNKENELINKTSNEYENYFKNIKDNKVFKSIIKTWLQANPRKIKRFIDVFEIYFKILMYRKYNLDDKNFEDNELTKYSALLTKMLIIKLEWDEVYKEFVKDKLYLVFLEDIINKIKDSKYEELDISFNLENIIKISKKYKLPNLLWMLSIGESISSEWQDISIILPNIYLIYYLLPSNSFLKYIEENENFENIWEFNLLKYLYSNDEFKINYYIDLNIIKDDKNVLKLLNSYLKLSTSIIEDNNIQKIKVLDLNPIKNVK